MDGSGADQFFEPILGERNANFRKLKTIPVFSVHLLISTLISLVGVILAAAWPTERRCQAYFVMMYLRVAFWVVTFVSRAYLTNISTLIPSSLAALRSPGQVDTRNPSTCRLPRHAPQHEDAPRNTHDNRQCLERRSDGHPDTDASILRR